MGIFKSVLRVLRGTRTKSGDGWGDYLHGPIVFDRKGGVRIYKPGSQSAFRFLCVPSGLTVIDVRWQEAELVLQAEWSDGRSVFHLYRDFNNWRALNI